jgi:hypothetical protein
VIFGIARRRSESINAPCRLKWSATEKDNWRCGGGRIACKIVHELTHLIEDLGLRSLDAPLKRRSHGFVLHGVLLGAGRNRRNKLSSNRSSELVYATKFSDVETVVVNGKLVMDKRKVLTVDEPAALAKARDYAKQVRENLRGSPAAEPPKPTPLDAAQSLK